MSAAEFEDFERAFSDGGAGCVRECRCGVVFFNSDGGWDWGEGELEQLRKLEAKGEARDMPWAVGYLDFDGGQFVSDCNCWRPRATRIINWLKNHRDYIVEFYKLDKKRRLADAAKLADIAS